MSKAFQVLFFTHTGAIKFDRKMKAAGIQCDLMSVPRALSSSCGVSARVVYTGQLLTLIDEQVEEVYEKHGEDYVQIYAHEE